MKNAVSRFGKFLSGMVMPNIGAFIAWSFLTALFIEAGWFPNKKLASMVSPMLTYLLPILTAGQGGKMIAGDRGRVIAAAVSFVLSSVILKATSGCAKSLTVTNSSVDTIPANADVVVCQRILADRPPSVPRRHSLSHRTTSLQTRIWTRCTTP